MYNNRVKIEHHAKEEVLKKLEEHAAKSNLPLKSKCGLHSQINVLLKSYDKERAVQLGSQILTSIKWVRIRKLN